MRTQPAPSPPAARRAIGTPLASVIAVVTTIIGLIVLAWCVLYVTKGRFLRQPFEHVVGRLTHRTVTVNGDFQLYFDPFDLKFIAEGMRISNPAWASRPDLFHAKRIDTRIAPLSLLFGRRHLRWLTLTDGAVDLEWNAQHTTNTWTFGANKGKPLQLPTIDRAIVTGTTLRFRDPRMKLLADLGFDTIRSTAAQIGGAVHFSGSGFLRETPFTATGALLSPNQTVARGRNKLELVADAAHNHVEVTGNLPSLTHIEDVPLEMRARGPDLAGLLDIIGVAVPNTRTYRLRAQLVKHGDHYSFTHLAGRFGDSDLAGSLSVDDVRPRIKLKADLVTRSLDIADLGPFIGYKPADTVKGKAAIVRHVGGHPMVLPDTPLRVDALKNFDADLHYKVGVIAGKDIPVSNVDLTLGLDNRLLKLSPLTLDLAGGHLASTIIINARRNPIITDYDIHLSPTPMGRLLKDFGTVESGTTGTVKARIKLVGVGNSVHQSLANSDGRIAIILPAGTMWVRNVQLSELDIGVFIQKMFEHELKEPVKINCGLIAFTVRNGIAAADPILIDTKKNVMLGRGGFSFKDEALDLRFRADAKTFSLFSGQSPVGIGGYFAKPKLDVISPQLVARGAAAVGLGVVASPIAAILAFVDPGDAKAAACGPVLAGAHAIGQRTKGGKPRDDVGNGTTAKSKSGKQSPDEARKQHKKFLGIF